MTAKSIRTSVFHLLAALALFIVGLASAPAYADDTAVAITPNLSTTFNNGAGFSLGYAFSTTDAITVGALGYFNNGSLTENHAVGIFTTSGTLLTSGTVTAGSAATANFSFVSISPFTLSGGTSYVISGTTGFTDPYSFNPNSFTTAPGITYLTNRFVPDPTNALIFPIATDANVGYFGPNFKFDPAVTPTPEFGSVLSLGGLLAAGGVGLWLRRRRRANPTP